MPELEEEDQFYMFLYVFFGKERLPPPLINQRHPKWEILELQRARFTKKNTIFPDFGDAMSLRILSTFDSRSFRRV